MCIRDSPKTQASGAERWLFKGKFTKSDILYSQNINYNQYGHGNQTEWSPGKPVPYVCKWENSDTGAALA